MFLSTQILAHLATTLIINFRESTHLFRQHRLKSPGRFRDEPELRTPNFESRNAPPRSKPSIRRSGALRLLKMIYALFILPA
jgi:hypothetical protein